MDLQDWLSRAAAAIADWEASFPPFARHPSLEVSDERFAAAFAAFAERLRGNYPYFHPSYAGQMLKPPHPAAVAGYLAAMLINPNNHALDGGPGHLGDGEGGGRASWPPCSASGPTSAT